MVEYSLATRVTRVRFPADAFCYNETNMLFDLVHRLPDVFLDSIVVSIPACHAGDPGSIPGRGVFEGGAKLSKEIFFSEEKIREKIIFLTVSVAHFRRQKPPFYEQGPTVSEAHF